MIAMDYRPNHKRRTLLGGGLALGLAAIPSAELGRYSAAKYLQQHSHRSTTVVPPRIVFLDEFGGVPGAGRTVLVEAFRHAFDALSKDGGGTLFVRAGTYDLGNCANGETVFLCRGLRDIFISAYGAVFTVTTTDRSMPTLFYFYNFDNVTIAGASFFDPGFVPWLDWKGMYCVGVQADRPSSGFHMLDCYAERVVGMFATNNNAKERNYLADIMIDGEIRNTYYGVQANYVKEHVVVDLDCHNVRRAFIAYAPRDVNVVARVSTASDWPGSNGLVALVSAGASMGNVERVRVVVDASGSCIHSSFVHFYHQGPEVRGVMRDIDATVNIIRMNPIKSMFVFDHENAGVEKRTARVWDKIRLHGRVPDDFKGKVISNASVTSSAGIVYVDHNLARVARLETLPPLFKDVAG